MRYGNSSTGPPGGAGTMRHKSHKNEPENRPFLTHAKNSSIIRYFHVSRGDIYVSWWDIARLRKFAGNSEKRPEDGKRVSEIENWPGKCLSGALARPVIPARAALGPGEIAEGAPVSRLDSRRYFSRHCCRGWRAGPETQEFRGSRPLSTRCSAAPGIPPAFSNPAPAPAPTPRRRPRKWDTSVS